MNMTTLDCLNFNQVGVGGFDSLPWYYYSLRVVVNPMKILSKVQSIVAKGFHMTGDVIENPKQIRTATRDLRRGIAQMIYTEPQLPAAKEEDKA